MTFRLEESKGNIPAIARAALGRPVLVQVLGVQGNVATVQAHGADVPAPFPRDYLFRADDALFGELTAAHERADLAALDALWLKAMPIGHV